MHTSPLVAITGCILGNVHFTIYERKKNLNIVFIQETRAERQNNIIIVDDSTMTAVFSTMIRKSPLFILKFLNQWCLGFLHNICNFEAVCLINYFCIENQLLILHRSYPKQGKKTQMSCSIFVYCKSKMYYPVTKEGGQEGYQLIGLASCTIVMFFRYT